MPQGKEASWTGMKRKIKQAEGTSGGPGSESFEGRGLKSKEDLLDSKQTGSGTRSHGPRFLR